MKRRKIREVQDRKRRENLAYAELANVGGVLKHVVDLITLQYRVASTVQVIGAEIEHTLEQANLRTNKTISIQNTIDKAIGNYAQQFEGAMAEGAALRWAKDLDELEAVLYEHAGIKDFEPNWEAMKEAKKEIEDKFKVKLK